MCLITANAVVPLGFDSSNVEALITALGTSSAAALNVTGATTAIVAAASAAETEAEAYAYGRVWYAAIPAGEWSNATGTLCD